MDFAGFPLVGTGEGVVDSAGGERFEITFGPGIFFGNRTEDQGRSPPLDLDTLGLNTELFGNPNGLGAAGNEDRDARQGYMYIQKRATRKREDNTRTDSSN